MFEPEHQSQHGREEQQQWHHSLQTGPVVTSTHLQSTGEQSLPVRLRSHYCSSCREITITKILRWTSSHRPPFPCHSHAAHFMAFAFILKRRDVICVICVHWLCWPLRLLSVSAALWSLEGPQSIHQSCSSLFKQWELCQNKVKGKQD